MQQKSDLEPEESTSGIADAINTGLSFLPDMGNADMVRMLLPGLSLPEGVPDGALGGPLDAGVVTESFADTDQTDGQQVIVANTGWDMDLWSLLTGQEQVVAEGGLSDAVDQLEASAGDEPADSIEFKSHGYENHQEVASGEGGTIGGELTPEQVEEFARVGELVDEDGEILMAGCQVGQDYTEHHARGDSMLDSIADASDRSVRAGVAIQLPFDGIEGSSVVVHPDGTYELDTSCGQQVYDVTANGLMDLKNAAVDPNAGWGDALSNGLDVMGGMASDYLDIGSDWWNGTHEAEGWDMLSPEQRAELGE